MKILKYTLTPCWGYFVRQYIFSKYVKNFSAKVLVPIIYIFLFFLDHYQNPTMATNAAQSEVHNLLPHTNNTTTLPPDVVVGSSMSKSQFEMVIMTEKSKKASEDLIQISKAK